MITHVSEEYNISILTVEGATRVRIVIIPKKRSYYDLYNRLFGHIIAQFGN